MRRPTQHIMETESENLLRTILPSEWIVRSIMHDYGVDFEIEIVDQHSVSGNRIWIQLKSVYNLSSRVKKFNMDDIDKTVLPTPSDFIEVEYFPFSIETKELIYALRCAFPLLLFVADLGKKEIFWLPIRDEIIGSLSYRNPKWRSQKTVTLQIPEWNKISWENAHDYPGLRWYAYEPARMYSFAIIHYYYHEFQYTGRLSGYEIGEGFIDHGEQEELIDSLNLAKNYIIAALEQDVLFGSNGIDFFIKYTNSVQVVPIAIQMKEALLAVEIAFDLIQKEDYDYMSMGFFLGKVEHAIKLLSTAISSYQGYRQRFLLTASTAVVRLVQMHYGIEGSPTFPLKRANPDRNK